VVDLNDAVAMHADATEGSLALVESALRNSADLLLREFRTRLAQLQAQAQLVENLTALQEHRVPRRIFATFTLRVRGHRESDKGTLVLDWRATHYWKAANIREYEQGRLNSYWPGYTLRTLRKDAQPFEEGLIAEIESRAQVIRGGWTWLMEQRAVIRRIRRRFCMRVDSAGTEAYFLKTPCKRGGLPKPGYASATTSSGTR
jgi:hypothetical protein